MAINPNCPDCHGTGIKSNHSLDSMSVSLSSCNCDSKPKETVDNNTTEDYLGFSCYWYYANSDRLDGLMKWEKEELAKVHFAKFIEEWKKHHSGEI